MISQDLLTEKRVLTCVDDIPVPKHLKYLYEQGKLMV